MFKTQRVRFSDQKGSQLLIQLRQMKDGTFQTAVYHTPKSGAKTRGCVGSYTNQEDGEKRFAALCTEAETKAKWVRKMRSPKGESAFDSIPKAAA